MQRILVTGGAGFIGGTFVRKLVTDKNATVVNLDCLTYAGNLDSLASVEDLPNYLFVRGNICDKSTVRRLLEQHQCTSIVNFAAESHVDRSISDPDQFVRTNVVGTFQLLEAAMEYWESLDDHGRDRFRFLHVSTDEVYGSLGPTGHFTETTAYAPNSPYSASKAASDHFVRAYHHTYGLPTLITNCSNNYGPYQYPEKLIPLMILNALSGKPLPVYGKGDNVRDWLHVEDHCRALQLVLENGRLGEVYNIGGNCELTNLDVVTTICQTVDAIAPDLPNRPSEGLIQFVTDRPGHDLRYAIDCSKIQRELNWKPEIDFANGIARTIRWYIENEAWIQRVCEGRYQGERLGLKKPSSKTTAAPISTERDTTSCPTKPAQDKLARESATDPDNDPQPNIEGVVFKPLMLYRDDRGWLSELFRHDELPAENKPTMAYVSLTEPGVARGPHEHVEQSDYFAFVGPGDFQLYLWDARQESPTFGKKSVCTVGESNPRAVIVPPGVVHAYVNAGSKPAWSFNAPNRLFAGEGRRGPVDEIRHEGVEGSPYVLDECGIERK